MRQLNAQEIVNKQAKFLPNLYSSNEENKGKFRKYFPTDSLDYNSQRWAIQLLAFMPVDPDTDIETKKSRKCVIQYSDFKKFISN